MLLYICARTEFFEIFKIFEIYKIHARIYKFAIIFKLLGKTH